MFKDADKLVAQNLPRSNQDCTRLAEEGIKVTPDSSRVGSKYPTSRRSLNVIERT